MNQAIAAAVLLLVTVTAQGQETPAGHRVGVPKLSAAPTLDGHLTEEVWDEAALIDSFTQTEPDEGSPASERTEVRIGYDEKNLYLGVRCFQSEPEKIVAITMERDARLLHDDSIQFVLDTFLDRQNAFFFAVTPLGTQRDALVRNEGDEINLAWDGIWDTATSRDAEGWSAEIAIPFRTLRFPKQAVQTWGFNFRRDIVHKRERDIWRMIPRHPVIEVIYKIGQAGELTGLENLEQGKGFDVVPYTVARRDRDDVRGDDSDFDVGISVKKNLSSDLVLDLSYNLDFAEAEADRQQVNLTRFKLLFPEKRDFFLESAPLFYVGERADIGNPSPDQILFFSRRIGLSDDGQEEIPVLGGAKISGRVGRTGIGFLNLTTDEHRWVGRDGVRHFEPRTNYTVMRLKRHLSTKSALGALVLNKKVDEGTDNRGAAMDWEFGIGDYFKSGGFIAKTTTPGVDGAEWAGMVDAVWDSRRWFIKGVLSEVGEEFNPEMGFYRRLGVREFRTNVTYDLRPPEKWNMRNILIATDFTYVTDRDGEPETRSNLLVFDMIWKNFVVLDIKFFDNVDVLTAPFEVSRGVIIPPGKYHFNHYFIGAQTVPAKPVFAYSRISAGEFYDGDFRKYVVGLRFRPMPGFTAQVEMERNDVELPAGDFVDDLVTGYLIYSLSPRMTFRSLLQWRREDNVDTQLLFQWFYRPGSAFFLVYDEFRNLVDETGPNVVVKDQALSAKLSYYF
ncbi:MAG: carbohydrate binding family 9 domain-containing protein [bacterium]|nr:carbohydrate binding family 9 domain-containing protein [bacterium]